MKHKKVFLLMILLFWGTGIYGENPTHIELGFGSISLYANILANTYGLESLGTYQFALEYEKSDKMWYSVLIIYENLKEHMADTHPNFTTPFTSVMAGVSYNYTNNENIRIYSGLAGGANQNSAVGNINLIGFHFKGLDGTLELNAGAKAMVNFGLIF